MSTAAVPNGRLRPPQRRNRSRLALRGAASRRQHHTEAGLLLLLPPPPRSLDQCLSAEELWLRFKKPKVPPARIPRSKPLLSAAGTAAAAAATAAATAAANGQLRPPSVLGPLRGAPAVAAAAAAAPGGAAAAGDGDGGVGGGSSTNGPPSLSTPLRGAAPAAAAAAAHDAANNAAGGAPSSGNAPAAAGGGGAVPPPAAPPSDAQGLRDLRRRFAAHSGDHTGRLTWAQLQAVGAEVGVWPEQRAFRRADKEKAGCVELQDALRVLYPRARAADVRWAVRHWDSDGVAAGDDHHAAHGGERGKAAAAAAEVARHLASIPLDALYELQCIFNLYRGSDGEGGRGGGRSGGWQEGCVTKEQLLAVFAHTPHITAADVSAFVARYSASKRYLTFPEFAMLMEHCVATDGVRAASSIRYSFTQKPQPMPEL